MLVATPHKVTATVLDRALVVAVGRSRRVAIKHHRAAIC